MPIVYDSLLIALGVVIPAGILAGPRSEGAVEA